MLIHPTASKRFRKLAGGQLELRNAGSPTKDKNRNKPAKIAVEAK
jgi:hypothetical protein